MRRGHVEIGMRNIGGESRAGDANRSRVLYPRPRRIALLQRIAADPLHRAQPAEHCRQRIADRKVLDFPVATYSSDRRTLQEAVGGVSVRATVSDEFTVVSAICRSWIRFRYATERCECENSAHLHGVAASALRAQIF